MHEMRVGTLLGVLWVLVAVVAGHVRVFALDPSSGVHASEAATTDGPLVSNEPAAKLGQPGGCVVDSSPAFLRFGTVSVGATAKKGFTLTNVGGDACRITGARVLGSGSPFSATPKGLGLVVDRGTVEVDMTPIASGSFVDGLEIVVEGFLGASGGGTIQVELTGVAREAGICEAAAES